MIYTDDFTIEKLIQKKILKKIDETHILYRSQKDLYITYLGINYGLHSRQKYMKK